MLAPAELPATSTGRAPCFRQGRRDDGSHLVDGSRVGMLWRETIFDLNDASADLRREPARDMVMRRDASDCPAATVDEDQYRPWLVRIVDACHHRAARRVDRSVLRRDPPDLAASGRQRRIFVEPEPRPREVVTSVVLGVELLAADGLHLLPQIGRDDPIRTPNSFSLQQKRHLVSGDRSEVRVLLLQHSDIAVHDIDVV